jgi:hypothetical protein
MEPRPNFEIGQILNVAAGTTRHVMVISKTKEGTPRVVAVELDANGTLASQPPKNAPYKTLHWAPKKGHWQVYGHRVY